MALARPAIAAGEAPGNDLGPNGEVRQWLMLGYIPLSVEPKTYAAVLDADLLAAAGGEAKVAPVGGQKVKVPASTAVPKETELAWRTAKMHPLLVSTAWNHYEYLQLFDDDTGRELPNTCCYLYTELVSPSDMPVTFMIGSDDSVKVVLNGKEAHRYVGQRGANPLSDIAQATLQKGVNHLLVRVDNYAGDGGLYFRLTDAHSARSRRSERRSTHPPAPRKRLPVPSRPRAGTRCSRTFPRSSPRHMRSFSAGG